MLEQIHGVPQRIADLKAKLEARIGKAEYKENVSALQIEIARLEQITRDPAAVASDLSGDQLGDQS